jgi:hypothetical protein
MKKIQRPTGSMLPMLVSLSLVGLIGTVAWGFLDYRGLVDRLDALPRTTVPGEVAVTAGAADTMTIFYEDPSVGGGFVVQSAGTNTLTSPPVEVSVTGPDGQAIGTAPYERDLRFDHDGRVVTAMETFQAPTAGTYTIEVTGQVPQAARVSAGVVIDSGLLIGVAGAVVLFLGTIAALAATVIVAATRVRSGTPAETPDSRLTRV